MDVVGIVNLIAALGGLGAILVLLVFAFQGDPERASEDAARAHFDRYGRWPDEPQAIDRR